MLNLIVTLINNGLCWGGISQKKTKPVVVQGIKI